VYLLSRYVKNYYREMIVLVVCVTVLSLGAVSIPWVLREIINEMLVGIKIEFIQMSTVMLTLLFISMAAFNYGQNYLVNYLNLRIAHDLRQKVFEHIQILSIGSHEGTKTGRILSNVVNDLNVLGGSVFNNLVSMLRGSILLVGSIAILLWMNWKLGLVITVFIPLVRILLISKARKLREYEGNIQERMADMTGRLNDNLSSYLVIRSFDMQDYEIRRFSEVNRSIFDITLKEIRLRVTIDTVGQLCINAGYVLVVGYGGYLIANGELNVGDLVAFFLYTNLIFPPIMRVAGGYFDIQRALSALGRIDGVLSTEPDVEDEADAIEIVNVEGKIEYNGVSFSYGKDRMALDGIDLRIGKSETVALVGASGAGKTTLVKLLLRLHNSSEGSVMVDGVDIRHVKASSLRRHMSIVPQEVILFNDTVRNNILYGRIDATGEEVVSAAKEADAHSFISELPGGYETLLGEHGAKLSGGQRQKITIARALLRNPTILILDEATSSVDAESEMEIHKTLQECKKGRTTIIIAHRLSTVVDADRIIVLESGRKVAEGKHERLLQENETYRRLYRAQLIKTGITP